MPVPLSLACPRCPPPRRARVSGDAVTVQAAVPCPLPAVQGRAAIACSRTASNNPHPPTFPADQKLLQSGLSSHAIRRVVSAMSDKRKQSKPRPRRRVIFLRGSRGARQRQSESWRSGSPLTRAKPLRCLHPRLLLAGARGTHNGGNLRFEMLSRCNSAAACGRGQVPRRTRATRSSNITQRVFGIAITASASNFVKIREIVSIVRPR